MNIFSNLSNRLSSTLQNISSRGRLTENNIKETLYEVKIALLEADVALSVVNYFIKSVKEKALHQKINKSLTPGQEFIKIVRTELIHSMLGEENNSLNITTKPPAVILIVGMQGAGKTTIVGKLGYYLSKNNKKKILLVSTDIYRPAAIKQLEILSKDAKVDFFFPNSTNNSIDIVNKALIHAKINFYDLLLVDTAGRLHMNNNLNTELIKIHTSIKPVETLFILDAMMGQDAAHTAKLFNKILPLTGIIITKMDGDARGGSALSIRHITGKPIKFIGTGEKINDLEFFNADKLVRRILGMDNIFSLIKNIENINNNEKKLSSKEDLNKIKKDQKFILTDFLEQIKQLNNIGNVKNLIFRYFGKIGQFSETNLQEKISDINIIKMEAIINSMTKEERINTTLIKGSRKRRIAAGSGMNIQDINKLLKEFENMQRIMKTIKSRGINKIIRDLRGGKII